MFRFSIRDVLWLTVVVVAVLGRLMTVRNSQEARRQFDLEPVRKAAEVADLKSQRQTTESPMATVRQLFGKQLDEITERKMELESQRETLVRIEQELAQRNPVVIELERLILKGYLPFISPKPDQRATD